MACGQTRASAALAGAMVHEPEPEQKREEARSQATPNGTATIGDRMYPAGNNTERSETRQGAQTNRGVEAATMMTKIDASIARSPLAAERRNVEASGREEAR